MHQNTAKSYFGAKPSKTSKHSKSQNWSISVDFKIFSKSKTIECRVNFYENSI
jgi:hypothetical protein